MTTAQNTLLEPLQAHISRLPDVWQNALVAPSTQDAIARLSQFLDTQLANHLEMYPRHPFRALDGMAPDAVRVVILGQDPYHGPDQAQGLAFSVPNTCPCPPSLRNIFKELTLEYPDVLRPSGHELSYLARQGVLLLNTVLTVSSGQPASHAKQGWEEITDALLTQVAMTAQPKVYLLWGAHAQRKQELLAKHSGGPYKILTANHPSPLSALRPPTPFIGCGHFIQANQWLEAQSSTAINWLNQV
ncbi:uracil-DNA glycosylase [Alcaligenaceae bacterium]|nr:uracil-DNA glycosylase [Alcaligenaceae bacterium]